MFYLYPICVIAQDSGTNSEFEEAATAEFVECQPQEKQSLESPELEQSDDDDIRPPAPHTWQAEQICSMRLFAKQGIESLY